MEKVDIVILNLVCQCRCYADKFLKCAGVGVFRNDVKSVNISVVAFDKSARGTFRFLLTYKLFRISGQGVEFLASVRSLPVSLFGLGLNSEVSAHDLCCKISLVPAQF